MFMIEEQRDTLERVESTSLLRADRVGVRFGGVDALSDVSIEIDEREVVGIIGPNGAGKTTLINVLSGFQRPSTGTVHFDRVDVTRWSSHRRARGGLLRSFQSVRLFPAMTVAENLQVAAIGGGKSVSAARAMAAGLIAQFDLDAYADALASKLPHGVERRVGIVRVLACEPRIILLDEPAAGLNERESDELGKVLHDIRATRGCGIGVIEHDMRLIMARCDRIQVLASGRTLASGAPAEVRQNRVVIDAYLGAE